MPTVCPALCVPRTVLMVIITMFIEHSPGTRLCFSEVLLFNPPSNPGREVLTISVYREIKTHAPSHTAGKWPSQIQIHSCLPGLRACPLLHHTGLLSLDREGRGLEGNPGKGNSMGKGVAGKMLDDQ